MAPGISSVYIYEEAQARDRVQERKNRTRRLIQKGAIVEKAMPFTNGMTLEELAQLEAERKKRAANREKYYRRKERKAKEAAEAAAAALAEAELPATTE